MRLFIAPHNDDETLFGSFTLLAGYERPLVIVALRSQVQEDEHGVTAEERELETAEAMSVFGCDWEQWPFLDTDPDWDALEAKLVKIRDGGLALDEVYAPAWEPGGQIQHNVVATVTGRVFGEATRYLTYTCGGVRSRGTEVPFEPWMIGVKLTALACYRSQLRTPSHVHFLDSLREYVT